jgi:hypothetical protein
MREDEVRAFRAADEPRGQTQFAVGEIDPRSRRVDDKFRFHVVVLVRQFVAQDERVFDCRRPCSCN